MADILSQEEINALLEIVDEDDISSVYETIKQNEFYAQIGTEVKKVKQTQSIKNYIKRIEKKGEFITDEDIINDLRSFYNKDLRNVFKDKKEAAKYYKEILKEFNKIKDDIKVAKKLLKDKNGTYIN